MIKFRVSVSHEFEVDEHTFKDVYGTDDPQLVAKSYENDLEKYGPSSFDDLEDLIYKAEVVREDKELSQFDLQLVNNAFAAYRRFVRDADWRASEKAVTLFHLTQIQNKIGLPDED